MNIDVNFIAIDFETATHSVTSANNLAFPKVHTIALVMMQKCVRDCIFVNCKTMFWH